MPSCARKELIDENEPGFYHCFNRCVRGEFLLGNGRGKKKIDYRKTWLYMLLVELSAIFAIDICKFAIIDNHFHLLLRNRPDVIKSWSDEKVLRHAARLFPYKFKKLGVLDPKKKIPKHLLEDQALIAEMRKRLSSISWLMKVVSERIAKRANREDDVKGHFWAGRFKCEKVLDLAALLCTCVYIDLNETRALPGTTPETSLFSSVYKRIVGLKARLLKAREKKRAKRAKHAGTPPMAPVSEPDRWLCPVQLGGDWSGDDAVKLGLRCSNTGMFEFPLKKYLEIVDCAGRIIRASSPAICPRSWSGWVSKPSTGPRPSSRWASAPAALRGAWKTCEPRRNAPARAG
jgi:REP element-mobilizing transposase RayT